MSTQDSGPFTKLFEEYVHRIEAGEEVDFDEYCKEHRECASELRDKKAAWDLINEGLASGHKTLDEVCKAHPQFADNIKSVWQVHIEKGEDPDHPEQIGQFRILEILGEGGMGTVYLAEQKEPVRRRVALKVIKLGMDSKQVLARFAAERQALAMMNHDAIARVFEAGTTDKGQPYFVMEYAPGLPLTEYCERNKLSIEERIRLFQQVCAGVQHAHQKGIIHRDLKPGNILVTDREGQPAPKIIDFGLARATDHRLLQQTLYTEIGQIVGTIEYMSPEQASPTNADIDTRTDVYALGVILHELLVGSLPFPGLRAQGMLEIQRVIQEESPGRPSGKLDPEQRGSTAAASRGTTVQGLIRVMRDDLDWVVLKALEKDRNRRYDGAASLAADLGRFLRLEPLDAGPPSANYRLKKILVRYKLQLGAAGATVFALVFGLALSLFYFGKARQSERLASQRGDKLAALNRELEARNEDLRVEESRARTSEADALSNSYALATRSAYDSFHREEKAAAIQYLDEAPPSLRDWEWDLLRSSFDVSQSVVKLSGNGALNLELASDGGRFAIATYDGSISSWSLANKSREFSMASEPVFYRRITMGHCYGPVGKNRMVPLANWDLPCAHFSPGGELLVSIDLDGKASLIDLDGGKLLQQTDGLSANSTVLSLAAAFSPAGQACAIGTTKGAVLWAIDPKAKNAVLDHGSQVRCLEFSEDGLMLVTGCDDGTARVWDCLTGQQIASFEGHSGPINSVRLNSHGDRILTGSSDGTARVWDLDQREEVLRISADGDEVAVAEYGRGDTRIVTLTSMRSVQLWGGRTGRFVADLTKRSNAAFTAAFSPDGEWVVTGGWDGAIRVWDASNGHSVGVLNGHTDVVSRLAFMKGSNTLLSCSLDDTVREWHELPLGFPSGRCSAFYGAIGMSVDPEGGGFATIGRDNTERIWDVKGRFVGFLPRKSEGMDVLDIRYLEGGELRSLVYQNASYSVVDALTGKTLSAVSSLNVDDDGVVRAWLGNKGRRVALTTNRFKVRLFDIDSGLFQGEVDADQEILDTKFSQDSPLVLMHHFGVGVYSSDGSVMRYEKSWDSIAPKSLAIHEGKNLVVAALDNGVMEVFRASNGETLGVLKGHNEQVTCLAFDARGSRLASGSADKTIRIWDTNGLREVAVLRDHKSPILAVGFSGHAGALISLSSSGQFHIHRPPDGDSAQSEALPNAYEGITDILRDVYRMRAEAGTEAGVLDLLEGSYGEAANSALASDLVANLDYSDWSLHDRASLILRRTGLNYYEYDHALLLADAAVAANPNPDNILMSALGLFRTGNFESCLSALDSVDAEEHLSTEWEALRCMALYKKNLWEEARARLHGLSRTVPKEGLLLEAKELVLGD